MRTWCTGLLLASVVIFAAGCNKGGSSTRGGPGARGSAGANRGPTENTFTLNPEPRDLKVSQGDTATLKLGIQRQANFDGDVTCTFEGLPTGVTVAPAEPVLNGGTTGQELKVTAAPTATPGDYTVTVMGKASTGGPAAPTEFTITVKKGSGDNANAGAGNTGNKGTFQIGAKDSITVTQGDTAEFKVDINRDNGFTQPVTVKLTNLPKNVTVEPATAEAGSNAKNVTFHLTAGANATPNKFTNPTIEATAGSGEPITKNFTLTIKKK